MHLYTRRRNVAAQVAEELKTVTYATPPLEECRKEKKKIIIDCLMWARSAGSPSQPVGSISSGEMRHPAICFAEQLKVRQHDPEETVRMEVVNCMLQVARKDFSVCTDEMLFFIRERTLDKKVWYLILYIPLPPFPHLIGLCSCVFLLVWKEG